MSLTGRGTSFPLLVTTPHSARHEVLFIQPSLPFAQLGKEICGTVATSPNCSSHQPAARTLTHLSKGPFLPPGKIKALRVRWARDMARDAPAWPEMTVVTGENYSAILHLLSQRVGAGRADVLEAEFSNWGVGEEGAAAGGERLPTYREVDGGLS